MKIKHLQRELGLWLKDLFGYFKTNKWFFIFFGLLISHLLLFLASPENRPRINSIFIAGFQLVGGYLIIQSIQDNMLKIAKKSLIDGTWRRLKNFPLPFQDRSVTGNITLPQIIASGYANNSDNEKPYTIDEKVEYLLNKLKQLDSEVVKNRWLCQKELGSALKESQNQLENKITEVKKDLDASVSCVDTEVYGIFYIAYGVIISAFS